MVGPYRGRAFVRLLLLAAAVSACRSSGPGALADLHSVGDLQARFNRDAGKPRIVLLLSPT